MTVRLVALLSWFEEDPGWLHNCVQSLAGKVDHLVALDGGYGLFPGARPHSDDKQHRALVRATRKAGMGLTLEFPPNVWASEMEKRTRLFRLGELLTGPDDWYFVMDADQTVTEWPDELRSMLALTEHDVALTRFVEPHPAAATKEFPIRNLFRAVRGLYVAGNHFTYMSPDGRKLWGPGRQEEPLDLTGHVHIEHRTHFRRKERKEAARSYYKDRDLKGVEIAPCDRCGAKPLTEIPANWTLTGEGRLTSDWIAVCERCLPLERSKNRAVLESYGLDPDTVQVQFQHQPLPEMAPA